MRPPWGYFFYIFVQNISQLGDVCIYACTRFVRTSMWYGIDVNLTELDVASLLVCLVHKPLRLPVCKGLRVARRIQITQTHARVRSFM